MVEERACHRAGLGQTAVSVPSGDAWAGITLALSTHMQAQAHGLLSARGWMRRHHLPRQRKQRRPWVTDGAATTAAGAARDGVGGRLGGQLRCAPNDEQTQRMNVLAMAIL